MGLFRIATKHRTKYGDQKLQEHFYLFGLKIKPNKLKLSFIKARLMRPEINKGSQAESNHKDYG